MVDFNALDPTVMSLLSNYFTTFTAPTIEKVFKRVFKVNPDLQMRLENATTTQEIESIFQEAVGVIDVNASDGSVSVQGGLEEKLLIEALKGIRFDHSHGQVTIENTTLQAPVLRTGGSNAATGTTTVAGGTILSTGGTSINVGKGAKITITGGAQITQK
ncbi:hypothetical protein [Metabacillus sediminilitoris]|uniref:Uncharacterized protein n=1 Tax=Metabacillus sediminilitoris TaxID=2567941 RepID=A0A4S4C066_9BACI|nr:hypothetical protein [Metabacillus sediminilitoris]QGQ44770.1 hypothetical protein GMB29_05495 [Metabacillus sediminilitoris]THF78882.1 hypothetical protein E6W99_14210 [Metabacillus sediminilitoris]